MRCLYQSQTEPSVYTCRYTPSLPGAYTVGVRYGGRHTTRSPFDVEVKAKKSCKVCAYGPGLERGVVGYAACFTVETNGETGTLGEEAVRYYTYIVKNYLNSSLHFCHSMPDFSKFIFVDRYEDRKLSCKLVICTVEAFITSCIRQFC